MIPTTTITFDGNRAWVVGTEWWATVIMRDAQDRPCDTCGHISPAQALADMPSMSRDSAEAIETVLRAAQQKLCPDCDRTGRHTFDIEVDNQCAFHAAKLQEQGRSDRGHCICGERPNTYRVSVVPGMVLPIHQAQGPIPETEFIADWGDRFVGQPRWVLMPVETSSDAGTTITLPTDAKPGMWAVELEIHQ